MTDHIMAALLVMVSCILNVTFVRSVFVNIRFGMREIIIICIMPIYSMITSVLLSNYVLIKLIVNLVLDVVADSLIFRIPIKKSLLINFLFLGIYIPTELVAMIICQKLTQTWAYSDITNSNGAFISELICQMMILLIIITISSFKKARHLSSIDIKGWITFILCPIITIVLTLMMIYGSSQTVFERMFTQFVILSVSMLLMNLALFYLLENMIEREKEIHEKQILIEQAEHISKMYSSLSEEREKQKQRSHDYLNHLNVMLKMAENGNNTEEIAYIKEQIGKELDSVDVIDTGNVIVNAVLNIKYQEATSMGIVFPLIADNLSGLSISDSDLVTILTNILDNAIAAVSSIDDKRIVMKIVKNEGMLCIDSSNPYNGSIDELRPRYTTNQNPADHGYGLANIKRVVSVNSGECFIEHNNGIFHITINLPMQ